jgi:hypothetical protein
MARAIEKPVGKAELAADGRRLTRITHRYAIEGKIVAGLPTKFYVVSADETWIRHRAATASAAGFEEAAEEFHAFGGEDAFDDFDPVVEDVGIGDLEFAADASEAKVAGAENKAIDTGGDEGSGAHDAGFEGAVKGGSGEAVVGGAESGFAQREDLGVGGGIDLRDGRIAAAAHDLPVDHDESADRDLARDGARAGKREGLAHEEFVGSH